jgi:hypothetical protein
VRLEADIVPRLVAELRQVYVLVRSRQRPPSPIERIARKTGVKLS